MNILPNQLAEQQQFDHHFHYPFANPFDQSFAHSQYPIEQVRFGFGPGAGWIIPLLFLTPFFFGRRGFDGGGFGGGGFDGFDGGGFGGGGFGAQYPNPIPVPYPYFYPLPTVQDNPGFPGYQPFGTGVPGYY